MLVYSVTEKVDIASSL